jgi:energy-coupling factor transporter ATP-binding protein EcfA2
VAEPVLQIGALSYRYPGASAPALSDVELELAEGEFAVLAGASGSGKSTLLRACCGLVPHYHGGDIAGSLRVCGLDVADHGPAELGGLVGLVAQEPESQVVSATVRGELELPLELRGEPAASTARAVEEVLLALGIAHLADRATDTLSGGELQRVALAAALVLRPRLVLLDEPTSQLDPVAGEELIGLLRRLNEEWGMGVVLAEHRIERCLAAADRVVAMSAGRVAFDGDPHGFCDWAPTWRPRARACSRLPGCARCRSRPRRRARRCACTGSSRRRLPRRTPARPGGATSGARRRSWPAISG